MMLPHLAARLYGTPLLIARAKLDVIMAVLGTRIGLEPSANMQKVTAGVEPPANLPEVGLASGRMADRPSPQTGIAVIPVHGTLVRRTVGLEADSGLTSYAQLAAQIDAARVDPKVDGILLDLDSPGGEAGGVFELAERIRAAGSTKPVWAHANDAAFSAAYAVGAAATRLTLSRTAGVGSIGVIALHVDQSVKDAQEGIAYTAITAGAHKNDFTPHAPLSAEAATALQAEVDRLYGLFVGQVAQLRGLTPEAVEATEAGLYFGESALEAGLADGVMSFETALTEFAAFLAARKQLARASPRVSPRGVRATQTPIHPQLETTVNEPEDLEPVMTETAPEPAPAPVPTAPESHAAALAHARMDATAEAQAIAELCLIAGCPQRTAEYLAAGMTQTEVRHALLAARAEQPEIRSTITSEASTASVISLRPESSPVVAAVKRLNPHHPQHTEA